MITENAEAMNTLQDNELKLLINTLKTIEDKMVRENECNEMLRDILVIHLAAIHGYYDLTEAISFLVDMFGMVKENDDE